MPDKVTLVVSYFVGFRPIQLNFTYYPGKIYKVAKLKLLWISTWPFLSRLFPGPMAKVALDFFLTPTRFARPPSEAEFFSSGQKLHLKNGIVAFTWGSQDSPIVALVHGWSGRGTQMAAFAEPLAQRGHFVVAFDGPAHGESQGTQTNVGEYVRFLINAQAEVGPFRAIIAHSFGAGCSVLAASKGLKVEKLVLVASPARYDAVVEFFLKRIGLAARSREIFVSRLSAIVGLAPEELNIGKVGNALHIPAMVVHDEDDKEVNYRSAVEIKGRWPYAELLTTKGLGHRRVLRDPEVIRKVCQFIGD